MQKSIIFVSQFIIVIFFRIFYFSRVKTAFYENLKFNRPTVIVSNHESMLDPFIIGCFLPLQYFLKISPFKFMINSIYYHRWWKPLAYIAGGYPTKSKNHQYSTGSYGVAVSVDLLNKGYSLVMFPEGKLIRNNIRTDAKYGICRILQKYQTQPLLARVVWDKKGLFNKVNIYFQPANKDVDLYDPDKIMDAIYQLPNKPQSKLGLK